MDNNQPIIVKRVKRYAAGHHGGSWKIAFADFATAMMAFFLVLWLLSSATPEQKKAISGYFRDPIGFSESASPYVIDLGGTPTPAPDKTLNPQVQAQPDSNESRISPEQDHQVNADQAENLAEQVERERLALLLQELQNKVDENPMLKDFKDQIHFEITRDGLRIQIVDAANRPMFDLGSARLQPYFEDILLAMAETIRQVPNKISISGHTDAKPYAGNGDRQLGAIGQSRQRRAPCAGRRRLSGRADRPGCRLCLGTPVRRQGPAEPGEPADRHRGPDPQGAEGHRRRDRRSRSQHPCGCPGRAAEAGCRGTGGGRATFATGGRGAEAQPVRRRRQPGLEQIKGD